MIKWDESYSTGEETVDSQHKLLFEFINDLNRDIMAGKSAHDFEDHLRFLSNYAKSHFCYEESCMDRYQCPAAKKNKEAHQEFIEFYKSYEAKIRKNGFSPGHVSELHHFIENWIVGHIKRIDTQLKPCIARELK